ncbi:hypothetical protein FRC04_010413 [Tulasnella sp. 424]|nr:hypothetical protein FRC04_010413 [Tulasnella sp. 424]
MAVALDLEPDASPVNSPPTVTLAATHQPIPEGHDGIQYLERSLAKSKDLPLDIYYLSSGGPELRTPLSEFVDKVTPLLSRSRSISLITQTVVFDSFPRVFVALQSKLPLCLETLLLKGKPSQRARLVARVDPPQLPEISAFPKLRLLGIDGIPCKLSSQGLQLHRVLSLNLMDVVNVPAEQLLDVLLNSPYLESLELGRSPVACPAPAPLTPIHPPHLTTLHLIFMPIPVSNFIMSTINAPNCSELSISSDFHLRPDDAVRGCLFTSSTNHFTPVLRTLLTRGEYKDIDITTFNAAGNTQFLLRFHDWIRDYGSILRLDFRLHSTQIEETVRWLGDYLRQDLPEISIRLRMNGFGDVHIMNLLDSSPTITHLGFRVLDPIMSNSILVHMAQPTQLPWPLTNLEVFFYGAVVGAESHDEAMLDMLQRRYASSSEGPDSERIRPRSIKRVCIEVDDGRCEYILREVQKILPEVVTSLVYDESPF